MFSKIERGDRRAKRKQVIKLAEYIHHNEKEMQTLWLADISSDAVNDDQETCHLQRCNYFASPKIKTLSL